MSFPVLMDLRRMSEITGVKYLSSETKISSKELAKQLTGEKVLEVAHQVLKELKVDLPRIQDNFPLLSDFYADRNISLEPSQYRTKEIHYPLLLSQVKSD